MKGEDMAKGKNERVAVTARGTALLALIAGAEAGYLMLTQEEGSEAVNAGHATVDGSITDGDTAAVRLTDAGRAALAAEQGGGNAGQADNGGGSNGDFVIEDAVPIPARSSRGRSGGYPFDQLQVGQSFHVPLGKDDKEPADVAARLQSSVSGARARYAVAVPGETVSVTVKEYQKGPDGKYAKGADGKRIVTASRTEQRQKMKATRDFTVKAVDASDPRGVGARVWRTA
jgi:hypothetical protein